MASLRTQARRCFKYYNQNSLPSELPQKENRPNTGLRKDLLPRIPAAQNGTSKTRPEHFAVAAPCFPCVGRVLLRSMVNPDSFFLPLEKPNPEGLQTKII